MTKISRDDVLKLAQLSRLSLSDDEIDEFSGELSEILQYVQQLQSADVDGLTPTSQVTGLTNVTRADEIKNYGYAPEDLRQNLPDQQDGQIKVRKMLA